MVIFLLKNLHNPKSSDALEFIEKNHKSKPEKTMVLIVGECMVDYRGRAQSLLDWGERIVMIKQDGTVLVHQPIKREPVNWQPSDTKTDYCIEKDHLVIRSRHDRPPEKMKIIFRDLKTVIVTKLHDNSELVIAGMEIDVVNQIISDPNIIEDGLRISKREKHVKSGLIDLFGYDTDHIPVVIEVKRSIGSISAVQQLRMYVNDVKKDVKKANVRGILCAPRIPDMSKKLLSDYGLEWQEVERQVILPDDWQKTLKDF
jgi:RecB family endonuclease NucS